MHVVGRGTFLGAPLLLEVPISLQHPLIQRYGDEVLVLIIIAYGVLKRGSKGV